MDDPSKSPTIRDLPLRYFLAAALISGIVEVFNSTRASAWPPRNWGEFVVDVLTVTIIGGLFWGAVIFLIMRKRNAPKP